MAPDPAPTPRSLLVLGGTAWLGGEVARQAVAAGHRVTALARGSAPVPDGVELVRADRREPGAYDALRDRAFDAVVDVSWQPGMVRSALVALADRAAHWSYVSSCSVYADHGAVGADESGALLDPLPDHLSDQDAVDVPLEDYGPAKVTCERLARAAVGDRLLVARAGLIGGPGDTSDRSGAWPARCALAPTDPLLVPATDAATQVVDARDLAAWLVAAAGLGTTGVLDAVGAALPLRGYVDLSREVAGHTGPVVEVDPGWLRRQGVATWSGPDSLTMWVDEPGWEGFGARSGAAAAAAGLVRRPLRDTLVDLLAWEREQGLARDRRAGLPPQRETLLAAWATASA